MLTRLACMQDLSYGSKRMRGRCVLQTIAHDIGRIPPKKSRTLELSLK